MEEQNTSSPGGAVKTYAFAQDIARYFKAFLETGLRGDLQPVRQIDSFKKRGLTATLELNKYQQLAKNIYKNVTAGLAQETFVVTQNKYVTHVDERVSESLAKAIETLDVTTATLFTKSLARTIDDARLENAKDLQAYTKAALLQVKAQLSSDIVAPIIREVQVSVSADIDTSAANLRLQALDTLYAAFETAFTSIITAHYRGKQSFDDLVSSLHQVANAQALRTVLREFLDEYNTVDAYQELYALHRNNDALRDTAMHLYFCDISVRGISFPLFYTVIGSSHSYPSVTLTFEDRIFVNTRAINFVLNSYVRSVTQNNVFTDQLPSLLYINPSDRKAMLPQLQAIIDMVLQAFEINTPLQLNSSIDQSVSNLGVTVSNSQRIVVFDKPNDSLVRDYQEIVDNPNSRISQDFAELLHAYVLETPLRFVEEVNEEWRNKSAADKLLSPNPLPLNDEQKQVLIALSKKGSNVVVVNGAPGTGKTHLVSGIVAQSFIDNKSTLVLSRSNTALDSVQSNVTNVLQNVRAAGNFHNPMLRLNQTNESLLEEVEELFVQKLTAYHETYTRLQADLLSSKSRKIKDATDVLQGLAQSAENINLQEVEQTVNNGTRFATREWIIEESVDDMTVELPRLHQAVQYIRASQANYLLPFIESSQQKAIADFIDAIREYEKCLKTVTKRQPDFIIRYRKLLPEQKVSLQSSLSYIQSNFRQFIKILRADPISQPLGMSDSMEFEAAVERKGLLDKLIVIAQNATVYARGDSERVASLLGELVTYENSPEEILSALTSYIEQVISLKSKIFGFSGRTLVVENLTRQLKKALPQFNIAEPEQQLEALQQMVDITEFVTEQLAANGLELENWKQVLHVLIAENTRIAELQKIISAFSEPADFDFITEYKIYEADNLLANISLLEYAVQLNAVLKTNPALLPLFGIKSVGQVLSQPHLFRGRFDKLATDLDDVKQLEQSKRIIKQFIKSYPELSRRLGVNYAGGTLDIVTDLFAETSPEDIKEYLSYKKKEQDLIGYFKELTTDTFSRTVTELQQITATQISHTLDTKLLTYIQQHADDFSAIRAALKSRQQLSPALFKSMQQFFPTVLAEIRDYATYLPLRRDLFDLVIIDEASGVTAAEALPALLRGKKVLILGEGKTLTSGIADDVDPTINTMHRKRATESLVAALSDLPADAKNRFVTRVEENFNVNVSILTFIEAMANYSQRLTKYFRSSSELISYVNESFYKGKLKSLKARTFPPSEIIKFDQIRPSADLMPSLHTNASEVRYIMDVLGELKDADYQGTIGILAPYFEQAVLIQKEIDESVINDWFERRKLTVMTLDTCEGEERDYMIYSMVSSGQFDHLRYITPEALNAKTPQRQRDRLLSGFSRAREVVHFVTSKSLDNFTGEAQNALAHFQAEIASSSPKSSNVTDILTAAESLIPQYFYATKFYKKNVDHVRLVTQFSLGDFLRQLSPRFVYPPYKVDFMITFDSQRIVVTYDEFKDNFLSVYSDNKELNTSYLTPSEIYNQKVLEGYGYTFIRLNRFTLLQKPVEVLDRLLNEVTKTSSWPRDNGFLN